MVLNVDNQIPVRCARTRVLRNAGFDVREAGTGGEALRIISAEKPDLVLLDVNLPDLDGHEVCKRIKAGDATAGIPVLEISASARESSDAIACLDCGADGYLVEPVDPGVLVANTHALIRMRRKEQQLQQELANQLEDTARLHDLLVRLTSREQYASVLQDVLGAVMGLQSAEMGALMLYDPERGDLHIAAAAGFPEGFLRIVQRVPMGMGANGRAAAERRAVVIEDVEEDESYPYRDAARLAGYHGMYCTPLVTQTGDIVGTIGTYFLTPHRPTDREMHLTEMYAHHAADVIESARLHAERDRLLAEQVQALQKAEQYAVELEQRAREAEEGHRTLEALMEHIPEGIVIADARNGSIRMISRYGREMAGRSLAELKSFPVGEHVERWGLFQADAATRPSAEDLPAVRAMRGEVVTGQRMVMERPNGQRMTVRVNAGPIRDKDGNITASVVAWHDITETQRAQAALSRREALLAQAQRLAKLGSWEWDLHAGTITYTDELYRVLDIPQNSGPLSLDQFLERVHPEDRGRIRDVFEGSLRCGRPFEYQHRVGSEPGEVRIVRGSVQVLCDDSGKPARFVGAVQDITDLKLAEEALRQSQKLESIGRLAGGIAHDFNNLLTAIIGNASLLLDGAPPETEAGLRSILRAGERGAHLVRQLLAYSGKGRYVAGRLDLSELIRDITGLLESSISPSRAELRMSLSGSLPPVVADEGQVQQLVFNLVTNSAEAIPAGQTGLISLRTEAETVDRAFVDALGQTVRPGNYVSLAVADNGSGIGEGERARIFDPFFTTKFMGRGLGLPAVAGIVQAHAGAITITSEPGRGTTFKVFFPAHPG